MVQKKKSIIIVAHMACEDFCSLISQLQNYADLWTVYQEPDQSNSN